MKLKLSVITCIICYKEIKYNLHFNKLHLYCTMDTIKLDLTHIMRRLQWFSFFFTLLQFDFCIYMIRVLRLSLKKKLLFSFCTTIIILDETSSAISWKRTKNLCKSIQDWSWLLKTLIEIRFQFVLMDIFLKFCKLSCMHLHPMSKS